MNKNIELSQLEQKYMAAWEADVPDGDALIKLSRHYRDYLLLQLEKNPKSVSTLIHLGVISWEPFHEDEKAIGYLTKAIEYDPRNVDARFWLALYYMYDGCDPDAARALLLEALEIDSTRADCLSQLASIALDESDPDAAIHCYEQAIRLAPDWPALFLYLSGPYLSKNEYLLAEKQLAKLREFVDIPPKKMRNKIESYYETIITGRGCSRKEKIKDIEALEKQIRLAKAGQEWRDVTSFDIG